MLIVLFLCLAIGLVCVVLHANVLTYVENSFAQINETRKALPRIWIILLTTHVIEMWLYAAGYWIATRLNVGALAPVNEWQDFVYFSAVVYTTLGFGDIVPEGAIRLLAASEALVGLCLIAWSATSTYGMVNEGRKP